MALDIKIPSGSEIVPRFIYLVVVVVGFPDGVYIIGNVIILISDDLDSISIQIAIQSESEWDRAGDRETTER